MGSIKEDEMGTKVKIERYCGENPGGKIIYEELGQVKFDYL